ncbi:MAG TPA: hypothetical protein VIJ23_16645 [Mycobacterium sp.]
MVAAHITGMPAALTVDSAAELAATLAHTSALLREDDSGYPAFRTVTPHLADTERRRHWDALLDAARRQLAYDDPATGCDAALDAIDNAAATDPAPALLGLDPQRYRTVNDADRPGENDYDGYDTAALALDLATRWDDELVKRARLAVDPHGHSEPETARAELPNER